MLPTVLPEVARDRAYAQLVRFGYLLSDLERDPRPSRIRALLAAADVADARKRLEDWADQVNTNGVNGEVYSSAPKPKGPQYETRLIGHDERRAILEARAHPELHDPAVRAAQAAEAFRQEQIRKRDRVFAAFGAQGVSIKA